MSAHVTRLNPEGLHHNPAFSQAIVIEGPVRTIYVGGQNAVTSAVTGAGTNAVERSGGEQARGG